METLASQRSLSYADAFTANGVSRSGDEHFLRLILPPQRSIRDLPIGYHLGIPFLALTIAGPLIGVMIDGVPSLLEILPVVLFYGGALCAALFFAARRLLTRTCIEVTPSTLAVLQVFGRKDRIVNSQVWRREQIGVVKRAAGENHLVIYILGRTMVEIPIRGGPRFADLIAAEINSALQRIPVLPSTAHPTSPNADELPPPMHKGPTRSVLLAVAGALGAVGLAMLPFGEPWCSISLLPFFLASVPAGIALGMQDKQGRYM